MENNLVCHKYNQHVFSLKYNNEYETKELLDKLNEINLKNFEFKKL
jgi:hypothetical protein